MERNRPVIHLYGSNADAGISKATPVTIVYCRERGDRDQVDESEWHCPNVRADVSNQRSEILTMFHSAQRPTLQLAKIADDAEHLQLVS